MRQLWCRWRWGMPTMMLMLLTNSIRSYGVLVGSRINISISIDGLPYAGPNWIEYTYTHTYHIYEHSQTRTQSLWAANRLQFIVLASSTCAKRIICYNGYTWLLLLFLVDVVQFTCYSITPVLSPHWNPIRHCAMWHYIHYIDAPVHMQVDLLCMVTGRFGCA